MVPLLYFFYAHPAWSGVSLAPELHAVVAHATSLFVIVPTALKGTWTYHRAGVVSWRAALPIGVFSVVAAVMATQVAPMIPAAALKLGFGTLLVASGVQLLRPRRLHVSEPRHSRVWIGAVSGLAVGFLAALLGVGGGIVAIPILVYLFGLGLEKVAATSMAIIVFTATAATIGYAATGPVAHAMPQGSIGYVHYLAGVPILVGSLVAVSTGARVNQRMSTRNLRLLFGILFILLGARLVLSNYAALPWLR